MHADSSLIVKVVVPATPHTASVPPGPQVDTAAVPPGHGLPDLVHLPHVPLPHTGLALGALLLVAFSFVALGVLLMASAANHRRHA